MPDERIWSTSLRQTFRLLPDASENLRVFLDSDEEHRDDVLARLPYDAARAGGTGTGGPNPKRYRDGRQVFRSVGLVYEADKILRVTPLGAATLWWLDNLNEKNLPVLARFASYALSAWQLRNPTREGRRYADDVQVFPYVAIWRVMLLAERKINSDELARVVLKITDNDQVEAAAASILQAYREVRKRVVFVSTDEVYGDCLEGAFQESRPLAPRNVYSALKAGGDLLCHDFIHRQREE